MVLAISVRLDLLKFRDTLDGFAKKQLPFAAARALTETARQVGRDVTAAIPSVFDRPTPFTRHAVGVIPARKETLTAQVFLKDTQAAYLAPSILGQRQKLVGRNQVTVENPKNVRLNQYGNIQRAAWSKFQTDPNVFFGKIKTADGKTVSGIFRRLKPGQKGRGKAFGMGGGHRIQLLVAFGEGVVLKPVFHWDALVRASVKRNFSRILNEQLRKALETAKR